MEFIEEVMKLQTENPDASFLSAESANSIRSQLHTTHHNDFDEGDQGIFDLIDTEEFVDVVHTFYVPKPIKSEPVPDSQESELSLPSPSVISREELEDTVRSIQKQNKLFTYHAVEKSNYIDELKKKLKESEQQRISEAEVLKKEFELEKDELKKKFEQIQDHCDQHLISLDTQLTEARSAEHQVSRRLLKINESHPELKCLEGFDGFELRPAVRELFTSHLTYLHAYGDSTDESQQTTQESQESQASPVLTDGSQDEPAAEPEEPAAEPEELPGRLVSFEEAREWMEQDDSNKIIIRNYTPTMVQKLLDSVEALDELDMELGALENMNIEFYIVPAAEPEEPAAEDLVEIPQEPPFVLLAFGDGVNLGSLELLTEKLPPELCGRVLRKDELHDYIIKTYGASENRLPLERFCVHDKRGPIPVATLYDSGHL
eukprot:SAG11_NODE_2370_length_3446_cov_320.719749_1_plen_432_part_00